VASGINNAVSRIAGMLSVALLGAVAVGVFGAALEERMTEMRVPPEVRRALEEEVPKLADAEVPPQVQGAERQVLERALDESFRVELPGRDAARGRSGAGRRAVRRLTIESPRDQRHG
jgi:hypothetical protein